MSLWDLTRTCFARLNGPQRVRVLEHLVGRHAGHVLQRDSELLTAALFGDDADQGRNDPLLVGINNTTLGKDQGIRDQLSSAQTRVNSSNPLFLFQTPPSQTLSVWRSLIVRRNSGGSAECPGNTTGTSSLWAMDCTAQTRSRGVQISFFVLS